MLIISNFVSKLRLNSYLLLLTTGTVRERFLDWLFLSVQ